MTGGIGMHRKSGALTAWEATGLLIERAVQYIPELRLFMFAIVVLNFTVAAINYYYVPRVAVSIPNALLGVLFTLAYVAYRAHLRRERKRDARA